MYKIRLFVGGIQPEWFPSSHAFWSIFSKIKEGMRIAEPYSEN
jgi:hypothetical protein